MGKYKDDVTFDLVLAAAEQAARNRQITVNEVTAREVKDIIGRGSDGYIGAHLQNVKKVHARAERLVEKDISHYFNAALYDEIKRHADNAREVERAEAEVTKQMFDEICECNIELEETLASKEQALTQLERAHADDVRNLTADLHSVQAEKSVLEVRLQDTDDRLNKSEQELKGVGAELTTVSVELDHMTKTRDTLQISSEELKGHLLAVEKDLEEAREAVKKADQRADLLNMRNADISQDRDETKEKLDKMTERATKAEAKLEANGGKSGTRTTKTNVNKK